MYVRFPLTLRNVEDLLAERGIDICHETVRFWWNRFGPVSAADIKRQRTNRMRSFRQWRWHLDEMLVNINGDGQDTADEQVFPKPVAVISLVGQKRLRLGQRQGHQVIGGGIIRCLATGQDEPDRQSLIVAAGVDFARKAAA